MLEMFNKKFYMVNLNEVGDGLDKASIHIMSKVSTRFPDVLICMTKFNDVGLPEVGVLFGECSEEQAADIEASYDNKFVTVRSDDYIISYYDGFIVVTREYLETTKDYKPEDYFDKCVYIYNGLILKAA